MIIFQITALNRF